MKITLSPTGIPALSSSVVSLGEVRPLVNGQKHTAPPSRRWQEGNSLFFEYRLECPTNAVFLLEITSAGYGECALRYSVGGEVDSATLGSFGLSFEALENLRQYLRHGYHSWDGSYFVDPEALAGWDAGEARPETGFAMTLLLPRNGTGSLVLGFECHNRFQQTFTFNTRSSPVKLSVETLWDGKAREDSTTCASERLLIFEHGGVEEALREWARRVVAALPVPPRKTPPITGWCSWYNLYNYATEENILEHLQGVGEVSMREHLPMQVFQIDDSFTPEMGDWLEIKPQFPRGMKPLLDDIRAAGFTPGLWIAPFLVGNRSHLYRDHPDWVLREHTGQPLAHMKLYGEFRWGKRSEEYYILDASHPQALEYLRRVFHTWHREWGCAYFKTDFMYFGCAYGPERVQYHTPGLTRIEIWRRAAETIREAIGDALWTGCGCPLWAAVGLVDGMRIGRDVGVEWSGNQSAQSLLRDQATRNFTNGIFWQTDPDCVLLRERFHNLADGELEALAIFAGMSGGLMMTSDTLEALSPRRLALWKLLLNPDRGLCDYPLLGRSEVVSKMGSGKISHEVQALDPVIVQVRQGQPGAVFIFNTGDTPVQRNFSFKSLGLPAELHFYNWNDAFASENPAEFLAATLEPHTGALFFVQQQPFQSKPGWI